MLDLIADGGLSKGHGKSLLSLANAEQREQFARRAAKEGWSVRELERAIVRAQKSRATADEARTAAVEALNARATSDVEFPVTVRALGEGFALRVVAADVETAERVLSLLGAPVPPSE